MNILEFKKIYTKYHSRVYFLRIEPIDLTNTLKDIFTTLSNLAWINKFEDSYIKESYNERAKATILDIKEKIHSSNDDTVSSSAAEYVVSELAREAIISTLDYLDIPLAELYNKKKSGNPGFDFHTQTPDDIIIFGEAKYLSNQNAYGSGLKQTIRFINEKKDIKDLIDLRDFGSTPALSNANAGLKGFAIAFSSKNITSKTLINNIEKNSDFLKLTSHEEIIMVAVNI